MYGTRVGGLSLFLLFFPADNYSLDKKLKIKKEFDPQVTFFSSLNGIRVQQTRSFRSLAIS